MKTLRRIGSTAVVMLALSALALAVKAPTGSWNGKLAATLSATPPGATPQQLAMIKQVIAGIKVKLTLKADKTYSVVNITPQGNQTDAGKWSLKGSTLTLTSSKGKTTAGIYSRDGSKITLDIPKNPKLKGKVIFARG